RAGPAPPAGLLRAGVEHGISGRGTGSARPGRRGGVTPASDSTAAAVAARRHQSARKLADVEKAIAQLRRERDRLTVRAIAARAGVSPTFLYENPEARALVHGAVEASRSRHDQLSQAEHERIEASWRERALNAEAQLTRTQKEVFTQRTRIGELLG